VVHDNADCIGLMDAFIRRSPEIWHEDIGAFGPK
jgi:hypothetical protein